MKKLNKLLATIIGLSNLNINASHQEIHYTEMPGNLMLTVALYLEFKDIIRLNQSHKRAKLRKINMRRLSSQSEIKILKQKFYLKDLVNVSLTAAELDLVHGISIQEKTQHIQEVERMSGVSAIPISDLLDKINTFVEKNTSYLNSKVYTKSFILPRRQNENCGPIPQNIIAAQRFVNTEVTESFFRILPAIKEMGLVDLILSPDHQSIIAIRSNEHKLIVLKNKNDIQYRVRNTHQNRTIAFMMAYLVPCYKTSLDRFLSLLFSDVERIGENEIVGFFDNREPTMLMNLQAFVSRYSNRMFGAMGCMINHIC